ncbi:MAG TPA: hypothetical protein VLA76_06105 [Candidatus Angelobacter sp.]|nr:hypothetical protein [Candidatus Angelobacter sp.]
MQWDLGVQGIGVLLLMALAVGAVTQLLFWSRETMWVGPVAAVLFFVVGIFVSEVLFGWATVEELQPNIDGLSFDEVLITALVSLPVVLGVRWLTHRRPHVGPSAS